MPPIKPLTAEQVSALIEEQALSREDLFDSLRQVMEIRALEDSISSLLTKGVLKGASHLYAGEEAVAVGAVAALRDDDLITSTHRGHGHAHAHGDKFAKTPEAKQEHYNKMMAEVMGKATGYCKGKGGSMHIADVEHGNLGATGIVGGNLPVAVGAALAQKLQGTDRVVVCFFGDGASNEGTFHEALNMASAFDLPVVFVAENNMYGMSVPWNHVTKLPDIADRACAYGIPGEVVDGMDALVVREAVSRAAERARRGEGPTLIEAKTYRYYGHSHSDPRAYRTRDEEGEWKEDNDPINRMKADMQMVGWLGDDQFDVLDQTVKDKMAAAMAFANASPEPDAAEATTDVYAPSKTTAADVAAEAKLREQVRSAPDMRQITYAAALVEAAREEMTARRERLHHGRGRRPLRRRVRRHARPLEGVRRLARAGHADLRGDHRRRGRRRGDGGHAADRRDHVRRLHPAGHGSGRQPGRQEPLHVRRQDQRSRWSSAPRAARAAPSPRTTRRAWRRCGRTSPASTW